MKLFLWFVRALSDVTRSLCISPGKVTHHLSQVNKHGAFHLRDPVDMQINDFRIWSSLDFRCWDWRCLACDIRFTLAVCN